MMTITEALDQRRRGLDEAVSDRTRGASQLARRCLTILADYARSYPATDTPDLAEALQTFALDLRTARPSMAAVRNLTDRFIACLKELHGQPLMAARQLAIGGAAAVAQQSLWAGQEVSRLAAGLIDEGQTVITHSLSSTLLATFRSLTGRAVHAVVTESCPLREGLILVQELSRLAVATDYITDAQVGIFAARSDLAIVGADSVLADGSVVNKAGTYLLALAARDAGIPFYACCESFKFTEFGAENVMLEEMSVDELRAPELPHVRLRNVYFDITPARLITAIVTEKGVRPPGNATACP